MDGKKLGRSEKYYGIDCLEVGGRGEGGMIADSQVSGVGNCRRRWQSLRDGGGRANSERGTLTSSVGNIVSVWCLWTSKGRCSVA